MNTVKKLIEEGITFHKNNKLNDAKIKYLEVLKIDRENFEISEASLYKRSYCIYSIS